MNKVFYWILLIITFSSFPYIGNYLFGSFYILISSGLIILIAAIIIPNYYGKELVARKDKEWFVVWIIYLFSGLVYAILLFLREGTLFDFRRFIGLFFKILFVISAFILIIESNEFVKIYLKANYVIAVLSIILFVLWTGGVPIPHFTFTKLDGRPHYFFFIGASNAVYNWAGVTTLRSAGFADEPGAFALMLNYFLIINEITFKNNKYRWVFTVAGILTFSLAFYLTLILFLIYWLISKVINLKKLILICTSIITIVLIFNFLYPIEAISKIFDSFFSRFQYNESSGTFEGDNRSESFILQWQAIKENVFLGLGDNLEIKSKYELYNPSIIGFVANYGLYGIIFFLLPIYSVAIKYLKTKEFVLMLVLLVSYLQRPGIEDMFSMLSLSFIFYYSYNKFNFE
jgi:hypothetical protein